MITPIAVKPMFLWLVLCFDGQACTDSQVLQLDTFEGDARLADCLAQKEAMRAGLDALPLAPVQKLGCRTLVEFERSGVEL
jgi:hypothetical protein